jgi:hypothetical protein
MAASWFVRGNGKVYGPLDSSKLKQLVRDGKIDESTDVGQSSNGPWCPAGKVKGLFAPTTQIATEQPLVAAPSESSTPPASTAVLATPPPTLATPPASSPAARPRLGPRAKMAVIAGTCSLISLIAGYFAGREHLRYQIRSSIEDAGKKFVKEMQEGLGRAFAGAADAPTPEKPKPTQKLLLGQAVNTERAAFTIVSARVENPVIEGGFGTKPSKHEKPCLVLSMTIANKDNRKQLKCFFGAPYGKRIFAVQDDAGNDVDTMFFSSPDSEYRIAGSHRSYKPIDPEQSVNHAVAFELPLPKTESLSVLVDMAVVGQEGIVQYDIPIASVEGFVGD